MRLPERSILVLLLLVASVCLPQSGSAAEVEIRILAPPPGEPAFDRVQIEVVVDLPPGMRGDAVELEIDGRLVRRWTAPPYKASHDFGTSGRRRRITARVIVLETVVAEVRLETPEVRIDESVDLELQQLYVTVTDRSGHRITDLTREDFAVKDRDVVQEIVTFGVGEIPFTAVLLVDSSLSMKGKRLDAAMLAARHFVSGMRPLDQVQVLSFSDQLQRASAVGTSQAIAHSLAEPLEASGGTAVRDLLFLATRLLERRQGRRALVLLTDGWDQVSVLSMTDVESALERSQTILYWVRLAGDEPTSFHMRSGGLIPSSGFSAIRYNPPPSSWNREDKARTNYRALETQVGSTGGRVVVAKTADGFEAAMSEVLDELHEQYAIGYYPRQGQGAGDWHPVSVRLKQRRWKVRTREGYVDR